MPQAQMLKAVLKDWNKSVFGDVFKAVYLASDKLAAIQQTTYTNGFSEDNFQAEYAAKKELEEKLKIQVTFLRDKARISWAKDGDRSSVFYPALLRVRKSKKPLTVMQIDDDIVEDKDVIKDLIVRFYECLFGEVHSHNPDYSIIDNIIPRQVSD